MGGDPKSATIHLPGLEKYQLSYAVLSPRDICLSQLTVIRYRVRNRPDTIKAIVAIIVRRKLPPKVKLALLRVLLLVQPVGATLPDVNGSPGDGLPRGRVRDDAVHERDLPIRRQVLDDAGVILGRRGVLAEEGPQDGRLGALVVGAHRQLVGDLVDEGLDADDVKEELGLVTPVVGHLPGTVEELDPLHPLGYGQVVLPREIVHVPGEGGYDLAHARAGFRPRGSDDAVCEVGVILRLLSGGGGDVVARAVGFAVDGGCGWF